MVFTTNLMYGYHRGPVSGYELFQHKNLSQCQFSGCRFRLGKYFVLIKYHENTLKSCLSSDDESF